MDDFSDLPWTQIALVNDADSGLAALISVQEHPSGRIPSVQLGTLVGPDKHFSPYLRPGVSTGNESVLVPEITPVLREKINAVLKPALGKRTIEAVKELTGFEMIGVIESERGIQLMGCLSCS